MASYSPSPRTAAAGGAVTEIKRPKTAWGLFLEEYKKTRCNVGGIGKFNELQKAASSLWKSMSPEEKAPWVEKEKINNDSYIQKRLEMGHAGSATPSKRKRASESKGYRRAFQFFVNEHRQQNPLYWSLFTFNQAQRELSAAWNAISMEEKQKWFMMETTQDQKQSDDWASSVADPPTMDPHCSESAPLPGMYSAAGMVPFTGPPAAHHDYFPSQAYGEFVQTDGYSPHYSGDSSIFFGGAHASAAGRLGDAHSRPEGQSVGPPAFVNGLSSRSHSDSDLQYPEKKRKLPNGDAYYPRSESSYSEGAVVSSHGSDALRGNFSSIGLDTQDYFGGPLDDGHTFDMVTNGSFLDADQLFSSS